jgi:hypothetical protein
MQGPVTFIVCGASLISGACLRILEQLKLKKYDITIIYIKSDSSSLSKDARMQEKITFGVLQEYARSDIFKRLLVIHHALVEKILSNLSIETYWQDINNAISSIYHMLNVFQNTEPLLTTYSSVPKTAKIATLGVVNYNSQEEKLFYDLKMARCKRYFFGINEKTLKEDKDLLYKIRSFTALQADDESDDEIEVSFSIYTTNYEENYAYSIHYASLVQEQKEIN